MDDWVKEVVPLLQYLIPGFLATWIFYSLTAFKRPDSFGQIVQALIFTFVIHGVVVGVGWVFTGFGNYFFAVGKWGVVAESFCSFLVAVFLGFASCYAANNDRLFQKLRNGGVTRKTSYPSGWFDTFSSYSSHVVLQFSDGSRLFGWPAQWPLHPWKGEFVIQEPTWLDNDNVEIASGAEAMLIDASTVQRVEFTLKKPRRF